MPAEQVEHYQAVIDREDGRIAQERLADRAAGRTAALPAVARTLRL
ncbi:MAG: hypothetical protein ACRDSR_13465 [Pseudonocardiaceae bacterium]